MDKSKFMTVDEFRKLICEPLAALPGDTEIYFDGGLSFSRLKTRLYRDDDRTPSRVQIEFNELFEVTLDPSGS